MSQAEGTLVRLADTVGYRLYRPQDLQVASIGAPSACALKLITGYRNLWIKPVLRSRNLPPAVRIRIQLQTEVDSFLKYWIHNHLAVRVTFLDAGFGEVSAIQATITNVSESDYGCALTSLHLDLVSRLIEFDDLSLADGHVLVRVGMRSREGLKSREPDRVIFSMNSLQHLGSTI